METKVVEAVLRHALKRGASDVHLARGAPPAYRIDGDLRSLAELLDSQGEEDSVPGFARPLESEDLEAFVRGLLAGAGIRREEFDRRKSLDFAYQLPGGARFRVNVYLDRGCPAVACRVLPDRIPSVRELFGHLPGVTEALLRFACLPHGLVLVTGPTGSGKSTTLAALVDHVNRHFRKHVITMEDPIEYLHRHEKSLVNQREVGRDVPSFAEGLRAALREDPDVILVGEMRDLETTEIALHAAKTGHLVLSTLHTSSAAETVERIVGMFPAGKQNVVRIDLADSLQGVVTQKLVPRTGGGRVAAVEILVVTAAVRNLVREGKAHQIPTVIQTGREEGMVLMEKSLSELIRRGLVSEDAALERAANQKLLADYAKV